MTLIPQRINHCFCATALLASLAVSTATASPQVNTVVTDQANSTSSENPALDTLNDNAKPLRLFDNGFMIGDKLDLLMRTNPPIDPESIRFDLDFEIDSTASAFIADDQHNEKTGTLPEKTLRKKLDEGVAMTLSDKTLKLTPEEVERKQTLDQCLAIYYTRQVDANILRPWSIMHGLIGYGQDTSVIYRGKRHNAIDYLCANGIGDDRRILQVVNGELQARKGVGVQGHEGQLLAMFAQSGVAQDQPMTIEGHDFTVNDLVKWEMKTCRSNSELTFKLLSLSRYLNTEETWLNQFGETWSLSRLVQEELAQPVNDGACGGSHRLMALSFALAKRREEGKPMSGQWYRAEKFIKDYHKYTWSLQNDNGSFSTNWFRGRENSGDIKKSLYTTGHILEWLAFSLTEEELDDPRMAESIDYLLNLMMSAPNYDLPVGPRGHAIRALRLYQQRVFAKTDYARLMADEKLVNNNPQNGGGTPQSRNRQTPNHSLPPIRRVFGRRW